MATKAFYLMGGTLVNGFQPMQEDGTAPTNAPFASATGWIVGAIAAGNFSGFRANTERATSTFTTTSQPEGEGLVTGATGNAFRSPVAINGLFASTSWTLSAVLRSITAAMTTGQTGRLRWRVFASVNADGTGARELTGATLVTNTVAGTGNTTADQANRTITWTPGSVTLNNEYLFFVCAYEIVALGGTGATRDANFRQDVNSVVVTPAFLPAGSFVVPTDIRTRSLTRR